MPNQELTREMSFGAAVVELAAVIQARNHFVVQLQVDAGSWPADLDRLDYRAYLFNQVSVMVVTRSINVIASLSSALMPGCLSGVLVLEKATVNLGVMTAVLQCSAERKGEQDMLFLTEGGGADLFGISRLLHAAICRVDPVAGAQMVALDLASRN